MSHALKKYELILKKEQLMFVTKYHQVAENHQTEFKEWKDDAMDLSTRNSTQEIFAYHNDFFDKN